MYHRKRNQLLANKTLFLTLTLHNSEPKELRKIVDDLSKKNVQGIITFLSSLFGGSIQLKKEVYDLNKNRKNFKSLLLLYEKGELQKLHDKSILSSHIVTISNLLECLY